MSGILSQIKKHLRKQPLGDPTHIRNTLPLSSKRSCHEGGGVLWRGFLGLGWAKWPGQGRESVARSA